MKRRAVIAALGGAALAMSIGVRAQQPMKEPARVPLVAILTDWSPSPATRFMEPFVQRLRDLSYIEGQNIAFESRHASAKYEILPNLAAELVSLQPDVILAVGTAAAQAVKGATGTIPIVITRVSDPIGVGLVHALGRPGANLTGVTIVGKEIEAKRLEFLTMAVPSARRVGVLWDPSFPVAHLLFQRDPRGGSDSKSFQAKRGASTILESALSAIVEQRAGALVVIGAVVFFKHSQQLIDLTIKAHLPTMFFRREFVEAGGLTSYAANYPDNIRRAAAYLDKILKGGQAS